MVYCIAYNKYVGPYCRAEMYTGHVACCPLASHGKYADWTDKQTDGRQTVAFNALRFPLDEARVINGHLKQTIRPIKSSSLYCCVVSVKVAKFEIYEKHACTNVSRLNVHKQSKQNNSFICFKQIHIKQFFYTVILRIYESRCR